MSDTISTAADLASRALLADLTVSYWRARKRDAAESRRICDEKSAKPGTASVQKALLPEDAPEYSAVVERMQRFQVFFTARTVPWGETSGLRALTAEAYEPIAEEYGKATREINETLLPAFVAAYPRLREEAKVRLNGLWKETDYPSPSEIGAKFALALGFVPVPTGTDFRTTLTEDQLAVLRKEADRAALEAGETAMRRVWGRLREALESMSERLSGVTVKKDGRKVPAEYRDTLFENLKDLCELMPLLNLAHDPVLDQLAAEAKQRILAPFGPEQCRRDLNARAQAVREVDRILALLPEAN